ncbi:GTP cyclohydrolase II-domain-containing protein [Baffinella frigidus]|nr:GTP cyclohydrolase II-domain-containing protein [Cryptophyta sp. CCMP2293]
MRASGRFRQGRLALLAFLLPLSCEFSQAAAYLACSGIGKPASLGLKGGQQTGKVCCETLMSQSVSHTLLQQHALSHSWQRRSSPHLRLSLSLNAGGIAGGVSPDSLPADEPGEWSSEGRTEFIAECQLPTDKGMFRLRSYRYRGAKVVTRNGERVLEWIEMEPVVMVSGDVGKPRAESEGVPEGKGSNSEGVLVRVHDQCFTSEVLGSKRCDCKEQLDLALDYIKAHSGAIIYMPQEGRGIGLANKIAAYELQDGGLDTVDANRHLGFDDDERSYDCVPFILKDLGINSVELMTNNPYKINSLTDMGVKISSTTRSLVAPNKFNEKYLRTKANRMDHFLDLAPDPDTGSISSTDNALPAPSPPNGGVDAGTPNGGPNGGGNGAADEPRQGKGEER